MKDKVEISDRYITKFNTSRFSKGFEWITESLSINHNREIRVYEWYSKSKKRYLLIPELYEMNQKYIKIEKLEEDNNIKVVVLDLIPNIIEFSELGARKKMSFYDLASSPTQSIIRGLLLNAKFLGLKIIFQSIKHLLRLYIFKPKDNHTFLIHKDLKIDQNMIPTSQGVYFIDFGSSILTKNYFLTDIVELAMDHNSFKVDFDLLKSFIQELGKQKFKNQYLQSQIFLLMLRRYLHFPAIDRINKEKMKNVRYFLQNLDTLVKSLSFD